MEDGGPSDPVSRLPQLFTNPPHQERRIDNLEIQMSRLIEQLLPASASMARQEAPPGQTSTPASFLFTSGSWPAVSAGSRQDSFQGSVDDEQSHPVCSSAATDSFDLSEATLRAAGQAYLTWCHSQPIVLFRADNFLDTIASRDRHLLLALQALSLRFPPGNLTSEIQERLTTMANISRGLAMNSVIHSQVELSTLQTFCLLSLVDFAEGNPSLAEIDVGIAAGLANSIPPNYALGDPQECSDCIASISMLQHLQGCVSKNMRLSNALATSHNLSVRSGLTSYNWTAQGSAGASNALPTTLLDKGILKYTYQLSEVWHMARMYAASVVGPDAPPPWNSQSDYSCVMQRHLEVDSTIPLRYRFYRNRFGEKRPESLQERRHYWGPYFFMQIIYATIPCLLNHPFLLSMRLRNFRHTMPQSFIHQSYELITRHAGWIMYFIDTMDKKAVQLSDPTLAHCIAITATIHLQHSFVQEQALCDRSQAGFDKCTNFLRNMGTMWPSAAVMAENLLVLQESVVLAPTQEGLSCDDGTSEPLCLSIDSKLLWNMLIYEKAGRDFSRLDQSIFGSSLTQIPATPRENEHDRVDAAYDLVGYAGISGHKTVPRESPAYAPEDNITPPDTQSVAHGPEIMPTGPSSLIGMGSDSTYEPPFFQANDFGRAIDEWMGL
ncbi:hypothetical protein JDV02_010238 [Purpureocillium takamizusanense]|uniref:Transcription factor domain-containing protein n=1 Tax=Purpureocillium takamizusanense TaxID=2060973 RepID=A0A9Q8VGC6_9HYPO|nr:uncharacterized protein JDV02_010238 [Purpureocillium takamizusanense]UNI24498.1 hypothetical protein JDV02_010238 [Purpureocillium takamizusanense]